MASDARTPEEIRADIAATRHAMAVGIEGLISEAHPVAVKRKAVDEAKSMAQETAEDAKNLALDTVRSVVGYFYDEGGVRWNNVGTVVLVAGTAGAAVGGVKATLGLLRWVITGE